MKKCGNPAWFHWLKAISHRFFGKYLLGVVIISSPESAKRTDFDRTWRSFAASGTVLCQYRLHACFSSYASLTVDNQLGVRVARLPDVDIFLAFRHSLARLAKKTHPLISYCIASWIFSILLAVVTIRWRLPRRVVRVLDRGILMITFFGMFLRRSAEDLAARLRSPCRRKIIQQL